MSEKFSYTHSFYLRGLAVITALFLANLAIYAQSNATDGALDGYVLDESGAVFPGAKIVARNVQTNIEVISPTTSAEHRQCPPESISEELILADLLSIACGDCSLSIGVSRRGHGNRFAQFCGRRFGNAEIGDRRLRRLDQSRDRRSIRG